MDLLVIGTVGIDDIKTPFGEYKGIAGGSATHFAMAASHLVKVGIVSIIGEDYPQTHREALEKRGIDLSGLVKKTGKCFHWSGAYEYDMNSAKSLDTQLGVLPEFDPVLTDAQKKTPYIFLANVDPDIQNRILDQLPAKSSSKVTGDRPFVFLDSMNFWITSKPESLQKAISKVDGIIFNEEEARQFCQTPNLIKAGNSLLNMGPDYVIIKKGEHGSLFFSRQFRFAAVAYPTEKIIDPTGAGDSFAGGFMSYLTRQNRIDESTMKEALNLGSVMASFMVEDFSYQRLTEINTSDLIHRYNELQKFIYFKPLEKI